jgi:hypothetical protein
VNDERQHNRENGAQAGSGLPLEALLSAYLDDRESLNGEEIARVETLLASDAEARRIYAELRVVVGGLRSLAPVGAPRSYHLDPGMVGAPEPVQMTATTAWYARHAGAVRWATAAAAILFVFVLSADLVLNGIFTDPASDDAADSMPANQSQMSGGAGEAAEDTGGDAADDASGSGAAPTAAEGAAEEQPEALSVPQEEAAEPEEAEEEGASGGETGEDEAVEEQSDDDAESLTTPEPVPTAAIGMAEDGEATPSDGAAPPTEGDVAEDDGRDADDATLPEDTARSSDDEAQTNTLAFNEADGADEGDSDRRLWRIAEFSLVVVLALLITAMIVLPRMARAPNRR